MYKNWQTICRVEDDLLRLLIATTHDQYVLAGLERGFPDLFSEDPTELRVPASALRKAAQERSREEYASEEYVEFDGEFYWLPIVDKFNIPIIFDFAKPDSGLSSASKGMPRSILEQLVGKKFEMGLTVNHDGIQCLVVDIGMHGASMPKLHEVITDIPEVEWMRLIPAYCVDLNS